MAYTTPPFFTDDWLNLYLDSHLIHRDSDIHRDKNEANCADYRFVYMGPKGTLDELVHHVLVHGLVMLLLKSNYHILFVIACVLTHIVEL